MESCLPRLASQQCRLNRSLHLRYVETRKFAALTVKRSKIMQSWEKSRHKLDPITGKPTTCSGKPSGVFVEKISCCQIRQREKMVSYSVTRGTSLTDGRSISRIFQTQSLSHYQTHMRYICGRKIIPSLQPKS